MPEPTTRDYNAAYDSIAGDSWEEVREFLANILATIEVNLLGPGDDGDESALWFFMRAIRRAHDYVVKQPCECAYLDDGTPDELCERCRVIGCDLTDHRKGAGCRVLVTIRQQIDMQALLRQIMKPLDAPSKLKLTRAQINTLTWPRGVPAVQNQYMGVPVTVVLTEAESTLAEFEAGLEKRA